MCCVLLDTCMQRKQKHCMQYIYAFIVYLFAFMHSLFTFLHACVEGFRVFLDSVTFSTSYVFVFMTT